MTTIDTRRRLLSVDLVRSIFALNFSLFDLRHQPKCNRLLTILLMSSRTDRLPIYSTHCVVRDFLWKNRLWYLIIIHLLMAFVTIFILIWFLDLQFEIFQLQDEIPLKKRNKIEKENQTNCAKIQIKRMCRQSFTMLEPPPPMQRDSIYLIRAVGTI